MNSKLSGRVVFFATDNVGKFDEARRVLAVFGVAVGMLKVKGLEVQSDSLEEIARAGALEAFRRCFLPVVVEDAGLFVEGLKGFPGPYAAYVYKTIGNGGLLKLMEGVVDRRARFESVLAFLGKGLELPVCFRGMVEGVIAEEERRGDGIGFGFDPVFVPSGCGETFAEMGLVMKNRFSHRAEAFHRFGEWYRTSCR